MAQQYCNRLYAENRPRIRVCRTGARIIVGGFDHCKASC
jgi:hypothetical protein